MTTLTYPIRVPSDVLESLGESTGHFWSDFMALEPIICEAIRRYVQSPPAASEQPTAPSEAGYQWKQVFLPDGTRLRASFGGQKYFAEVKGGEIIYGEQALSPSRFANLRGSGNRNAWKAVWLRLPGSEEWLLADVCRSARKAAIARLIEGDATTERAPRERKAPQATPSTLRHTEGKRPSQEAHAEPAGRAAEHSTATVAGRNDRRKHRAKKHHRKHSR